MRCKCLLLVFLLAATPCFSQGILNAIAGCDFAGTWYGGSPDVPFPYYHLTINPIGLERYSVIAQYASETQSAGYLHNTVWTGEFSKTGRHSYTGMVFSMWQWDPSSSLLPAGVDATLPEMDLFHINSVEVLDHDTLRFTYDKAAVYFSFMYPMSLKEKPPDPGFVATFDPLLVEVYHRMPTSFPAAFH